MLLLPISALLTCERRVSVSRPHMLVRRSVCACPSLGLEGFEGYRRFRARHVERVRAMELSAQSGGNEVKSSGPKLPVLLFDVMGTIVRDPFYDDVPRFLGLSMKELLEIKHPTAWIEFEKGLIEEEELKLKFFSDGRKFDFNGLKACMFAGYEFIEGMEPLLGRLKDAGYDMHAFTNYPSWYKMIEEKLKLSQYLRWTFVSCHTGKRKPDGEAYVDAVQHLQVDPSDCAFIDDQRRNVEGAKASGLISIAFENAEDLERDLIDLGLKISSSSR